ncbi:MAG: leucyl/phenylalanyl-tRNA--protein transferase [Gammaproteobacteria bacterium]|nr:leucyl/phenylalanyl-tRNA--protein transferase [Gammaproteobacteria bacterium]
MPFPEVEYALEEPNGLLAIGGDLHPQRILNAYRQGIFPWYSAHQPILWWSPDPRLVLFPEELHVSRSMRKFMRQSQWNLTMDTAFEQVTHACSLPRPGQPETWLSPEMQDAYLELHRLGYAHSVEVWDENEKLIGGLYGIAIGSVFFGESMFSFTTNASKFAFISFVEQISGWGFKLIDCQVETTHLNSLGAANIPREKFITFLDQWCSEPVPNKWNTK